MKILKEIIRVVIVLAGIAVLIYGIFYMGERRQLPWQQPDRPMLVTEIDGVKLYKFKDGSEWIYFSGCSVHKVKTR